MTALAIGTLLAVGALAFVLYPLFFGMEERIPSRRLASRKRRPGADSLERELAVAALREIEFDHVTGKLSDADYAQLRQRYRQQAVLAMRKERDVATDAVDERASDSVAGMGLSDDDIERTLALYRATHLECAACGPRPEPDAVFCSACGRSLAA